MPDLEKAKKHIAEAADLCVEAGRLADLQTNYAKVRDTETKPKRVLLNPEPARLTAKKKYEALDKIIDEAEKKAVAHDYVTAVAGLETARAETGEMAALKAADEKYSELQAKVKLIVDGLVVAPGKTHATIGPDITAAALALEEAEKKATELAFPEAMSQLETASVKGDSATIKNQIKGGAMPPTTIEADLKALAGKPGGIQALDEIVSKLTKDDHPEFMLAALKARFKLDAATKEGTEANEQVVLELKKIYEVMTMVPDSHTQDNPSFKKVVRKPKSGSSYDSNKTEKAIVMGEGHPDTSGPREVAIASELPDIEEDSKPNTATPTPKFFSWNTLHEVGHALDDKKHYMQTRGKADDHGAWASHGSDVMTIATAAEGEFNIKAALIASYLKDKTEPTPLPTDWAKVKTWAETAGKGKIPWKNGAACGKAAAQGGLMIGDRIYHEAYDNDWVSYKASARKQGITGYQFRAAGEWFSELYAAYKTDKLKSSHPAKPWLDKLFKVKTN